MGRNAAREHERPSSDASGGAEPSTADLPGAGMLSRAFSLVRALASFQSSGARVTQLAKAVGLTQGTTHRICVR